MKSGDELDQALGHGLVIEGIVDALGGRRACIIRRHFQVDCHYLADLALPVIDTDDGFYA